MVYPYEWSNHIPSGKLLHSYGKSPFYSWENPLVQWPFSIAFCMFTRGSIHINGLMDTIEI